MPSGAAADPAVVPHQAADHRSASARKAQSGNIRRKNREASRYFLGLARRRESLRSISISGHSIWSYDPFLRPYSVGGGAFARMVPSALVTRAIKPVFEPSFAGLMSTVTVSPGFNEFLLQPERINIPGARPSMAHSTFPPFPSSTVRPSQVCGFAQRNSFTTPVTVMILVTSNATLLWCGNAGVARNSAASSPESAIQRICILPTP